MPAPQVLRRRGSKAFLAWYRLKRVVHGGSEGLAGATVALRRLYFAV